LSVIRFEDLPALNAGLNSATTVLLVTGFLLIRRGRVAAHRACMLGALTMGTLFLASYLTYHARIGSKPFEGEGWIRPVYFSILISHTLLAAAVVPMAIVTATRGLKGRFDRHKRLARWTFPIWLYVSVTGVVIYLMLYQLPF
jgi:uncharacterized membrane protein YozB (DUF420 family)